MILKGLFMLIFMIVLIMKNQSNQVKS